MTAPSPKARPLTSALLAPKGAARPSSAPQLSAAPLKRASMFSVSPQEHAKAAEKQKTAQSVGAAPKTAFTFRMDEARHFKMRLLSAHQNRSAQKIMEDAFDAYLEGTGLSALNAACPCLSADGKADD